MKLRLQHSRLSKNELRAILRSCSPEPGATDEISIRPLRTTNNSILSLATSPGLPLSLLIKQVKTGDVDAQYASLLAAFKKMDGDAYRVPTPIRCVPEQNVIVMEYVKGESLDRLLLRKDVNEHDKENGLKESAIWLARFHTAFETGAVDIGSVASMSNVQEALAGVQASLARQPELAAVWRWIQAGSQRFQDRKTASGHIHGDFKQENILCSQGSIHAIDFLMTENGIHLMDLVQYTNHLLFLTLKRAGKPYQNETGEWTRLFLASYAQDKGTMIDAEALDWLRLQHLLRYWALQAASKNPLAQIEANRLKQQITRVYRAMEV